MVARPLSDFLPYQDLFHNGVMRLTGNGLMAIIEYRGVDYETTPNNNLLQLCNRLAAYIANFGTQSGWTLNTDTCLVEAGPYLCGPRWMDGQEFPSSATGPARFLDDERAQKFAGHLSDERSFIAITMRPPAKRAAFLEKMIKKGGPEKTKHWVPYIDDFTKAINAMLTALNNDFGGHGFARRMDGGAVRRYMEFAITGQVRENLKFPSGVVSWPFAGLVKSKLLLGRQVRIDGFPIRHVRSVGLAGCPAHHTPEMLAGLMRIGHPLRISQRFCLKPANSVHDHYRQGIRNTKDAELSIFGHVANMLPSMRTMVSPDPINMAKTIMDTTEAQDTARIECGGTLTTNVLVYADSWQEANARADAVAQFMTARIGFKAEVENANARAAFIGSFPGEVDRNKRGDVLANDFLARRMRVTAPWVGSVKSRSPWGGAPLVQAVTEGNAKFLFDPFGEKWGHILWTGPNGAGKSTAVTYFGSAWHARHPNGRVIQIEADSALSSSVVSTLAHGGRIVSMNDGGMAIQPLRHLDDPDVLTAKHGWIQSICTAQNVELSPDLNDDIMDGLKLLATERPDRRTMNNLYRLVPSPALRKALNVYCNDGPYAHLLSGTRNPFEGTNHLLLELGRFAEKKSPLDGPIIEATMYEVEQAIDGETPTFTIIDEGKMTVRAMGEDRAVDYAARMRKKRCILAFIFHFVDQDFVNLSAALREQCAWRLFSPNANAMDSGSREWMEKLGVTETMAQQIAQAPKGCIAGVHGMRARMFDLSLGPAELALCGINGKTRNEVAVDLYNRVGPDRFWIEHLKMEGVNVDESKYLVARPEVRYAAE